MNKCTTILKTPSLNPLQVLQQTLYAKYISVPPKRTTARNKIQSKKSEQMLETNS